MTTPIRPRIREGLSMVEIDGEGVVYDPENCDIHHLNTTATVVYQLCDGTATIPELAAEIADALEMPVEPIERDVKTVLETFGQEGLLASSEESAARTTEVSA